ncbi:hypothetical protein D3C72_1757070 [compost metagenome]
MADSSIPDAVSTAAASSVPITNGLGMFSRFTSSATPSVIATSASSPGALTTRGPGI